MEIKEYINEEWRPVIGYYGLYEASNMGRVRALKWHRGNITHILKPCKDSSGYYQVALYKDGTRKLKMVHRLVAEAFIPNPNNYPCINHKDYDTTNNCVDNLEWCSYSYNNNYGNGPQKRRNTLLNRKDHSKPVCQYSLDGKLIKTYPSIKEAARQINGNEGTISSLCNNYKWRRTYKNFKWGFEKERVTV